MKAKSNSFAIIIAFFSGALVCYFLSQWRFLVIDTQVNVVETIIALISIVIGIFIAVHIQKRNNQNQNRYNYLMSRLDPLWTDFNIFFLRIEQTDTIPLREVTSFVKRFHIRSTDLAKLLQPISVSSSLDTVLDEFESVFANSLIRNNIVYYDGEKDRVTAYGKRIQEVFTEIYQAINENS